MAEVKEKEISPGAVVAIGLGLSSIAVLGLAALALAAKAGEVSGEILEIMWRLSAVDEWHPTSDPMPAYTDVRYRFTVRNTGLPAKFKAGYYHENYGAGWRYSSPITLDTGEEGDIIWSFSTGAPRGTFDFIWYLFGDSKQIDSVVVTTTVI
ncbi:hypothetical protein ES708_34561 [subsurface metagenome]